MVNFRWLTAALRVSGAWSFVATAIRHAGWQAIMIAVVGVLWLTAFGLLLAGATIWIATQLGVAAACAIVGALLALAGCAVLLVMHHRASHRPAGIMGLAPGLEQDGDAPEVSDNEAIESLAGLAFIGYILGRLVKSS